MTNNFAGGNNHHHGGYHGGSHSNYSSIMNGRHLLLE